MSGFATPYTWATSDSITSSRLNAMQTNILESGRRSHFHAIVGTGAAIASNASETYGAGSSEIAFDSLTLSKDASIASYRVTVSAAGIWVISAGIRWPATAAATGSSQRACKLYVNGAASSVRDIRSVNQNVDTICTLTASLVSLAAGGYVQVRGWQNSGSNQTPLLECYIDGWLMSPA